VAFWLIILLGVAVAVAAGLLSLVLIFFGAAFWKLRYPSDDEMQRSKTADLLQAKTDRSNFEDEYLASLRWRSPANRFFLAMPKIFGVVFLTVFAACYWLAGTR
jgi:hypothetical protein